MSEQTAVRTREKWVDDVKVIACILVVLGHFLASVQSYAPGGVLYEWFHKTIYYFHVPLFFICSGYLYQKYIISFGGPILAAYIMERTTWLEFFLYPNKVLHSRSRIK